MNQLLAFYIPPFYFSPFSVKLPALHYHEFFFVMFPVAFLHELLSLHELPLSLAEFHRVYRFFFIFHAPCFTKEN
jgi:hypothetical protein